MIREGKDAKDTINEVWQSFSNLRKEDDRTRAILYGRHGDLLLGGLKEIGLNTRVAQASGACDHFAHDAEAQLRRSLQFYADAKHPRQQTKADAIEIAAAHCWNKLDPGGRTSLAIRRGLVVSPFVDVWMCWRPFRLPKDKDKQEEYRDSYFPCYLEVGNGRSSAFLEDQGIVSLAVMVQEKAIVRALHDYDKKPTENRKPQQILEEDYRAQFGIAEGDGTSMMTKKVKIHRIADEGHICEYVENISDGTWSPISAEKDNEPYANPFGRIPFMFGCGAWNPDATRIEDRYQGGLRPLLDARYNMDLIASIELSLASALPLKIMEADPAVLIELAGMTVSERQEYIESMVSQEVKGWFISMGKAQAFDMPVPALLAERYKEYKEEYYRLLPYMPPTDETISKSTVSAVVLQDDRKQQRYAQPVETLGQIVHDSVQMSFNVYRPHDKSIVYNTPKAPEYETLRLTTTKGMAVRGKEIQAGKSYQLGPEELGPNDDWYDLYVVPIDMTPTAKAARQETAERRASVGMITKRERAEAYDVSNPDEYYNRLKVEKLLDGSEAQFAAVEAARSVRYKSMQDGTSEQEILQLMSAAPPMAPPQSNGGGMNGNTLQVKSPEGNQAPVEVTG